MIFVSCKCTESHPLILCVHICTQQLPFTGCTEPRPLIDYCYRTSRVLPLAVCPMEYYSTKHLACMKLLPPLQATFLCLQCVPWFYQSGLNQGLTWINNPGQWVIRVSSCDPVSTLTWIKVSATVQRWNRVTTADPDSNPGQTRMWPGLVNCGIR